MKHFFGTRTVESEKKQRDANSFICTQARQLQGRACAKEEYQPHSVASRKDVSVSLLPRSKIFSANIVMLGTGFSHSAVPSS
jgi:hypothetical protein